MTVIDAAKYRIADGENATGSLQPLYALDPPKFIFARGGLNTEWHECEEWVVDGARVPRKRGRAWCAWLLTHISREEFNYLKQNFGVLVTIETYDTENDAFYIFNARMWLYDLSRNAEFTAGEWFDVRIEFRDLVDITP